MTLFAFIQLEELGTTDVQDLGTWDGMLLYVIESSLLFPASLFGSWRDVFVESFYYYLLKLLITLRESDVNMHVWFWLAGA